MDASRSLRIHLEAVPEAWGMLSRVGPCSFRSAPGDGTHGLGMLGEIGAWGLGMRFRVDTQTFWGQSPWRGFLQDSTPSFWKATPRAAGRASPALLKPLLPPSLAPPGSLAALSSPSPSRGLSCSSQLL